MSWQHSLSLKSAYIDPQFTNYVCGFHDVLDYIFFDPSHVRCTRTVTLPGRDEVTELSALPNPKFPSDHLALVCDLEFMKV